MKKLLIVIIILLLIIIFLLLYCNCWKKGGGTGPSKPQTGFCADAQCLGYTGDSPEDMIEYALALQMSRDYAADMGKKFVWEGDVRTDSFDARSIWFDLKKLKEYIAYIEKGVCDNNCNDSTALGIRFYYAKYPSLTVMKNTPALRLVPPEYARKHTLFLVPTYWDAAFQMNVDFDPSEKREHCRLQPIDSVKGHVGFPHVTGDGGDGTGDEQNHGSLMPPPAGRGTFPTPGN